MDQKNIVFITAITYPGKESRSLPYQFGIDSWKYWCEKNNCELFVLNQPLFDADIMVPNYYRYWCFDLLDNMDIKYNQILLSDADCIIHPNCPNFFEMSEDKYAVTHTDGSYDWTCRSMENYSKYLFNNYTFDIFQYFNAGFQIINKKHRNILEQFKNFYLENREYIQQLQRTLSVGTDQPLINFLVHQNNVELKFLPYRFCMADLHRKGLLDNELSFLRIPGIYQFNAIPNNSKADLTYDFMKKTFNKIYNEQK